MTTPPTDAELCARLRQLAGNTGKMTWHNGVAVTASDALRQAADRIEQFSAENARLRGAMQAFLEDRASWFTGPTGYDRLRQALGGSHDQ